AIQSLAYRVVGRRVLEAADQVVFVNPSVRDKFASIRFRRPAEVIENGLDLELFRYEPGPDPAETNALFVGRFVEKKGLHVLHHVAQATPTWNWTVVGMPGEVNPATWELSNVTVLG